MESGMYDYLDDPVPSYEESMSGGGTGREASTDSKAENPPQNPFAPLSQQVSEVRTRRIKAILNAYIDPLLQSQAAAGLSRATLVLVPSNASALQPPENVTESQDIIEGTGDSVSRGSNEEAVLGFPSNDYVKLVRLHGEENVMAFWSQPAVIKDLEATLKARLQASGHRIAGAEPKSPEPPTPVETPPPGRRRGFFQRKPSEATQYEPQVSSALADLGWRSNARDQIEPGTVHAQVALKEVSLRVINQMGLYETRAGKAVVVEIEIGSS
jgi:hypothetical protein